MTRHLIEISAEAETDIENASEYYDGKVPGLSLRFLNDLLLFHHYRLNTAIRRCNLNIFPYAVYFTITGEVIKILAVMHERRSKSYIKRKLT